MAVTTGFNHVADHHAGPRPDEAVLRRRLRRRGDVRDERRPPTTRAWRSSTSGRRCAQRLRGRRRTRSSATAAAQGGRGPIDHYGLGRRLARRRCEALRDRLVAAGAEIGEIQRLGPGVVAVLPRPRRHGARGLRPRRRRRRVTADAAAGRSRTLRPVPPRPVDRRAPRRASLVIGRVARRSRSGSAAAQDAPTPPTDDRAAPRPSPPTTRHGGAAAASGASGWCRCRSAARCRTCPTSCSSGTLAATGHAGRAPRHDSEFETARFRVDQARAGRHRAVLVQRDHRRPLRHRHQGPREGRAVPRRRQRRRRPPACSSRRSASPSRRSAATTSSPPPRATSSARRSSTRSARSHVDGTPVDASVHQRRSLTSKGRLLRAFLLPLLVAFGVIFGLVMLRWLFTGARQGRRRRSCAPPASRARSAPRCAPAPTSTRPRGRRPPLTTSGSDVRRRRVPAPRRRPRPGPRPSRRGRSPRPGRRGGSARGRRRRSARRAGARGRSRRPPAGGGSGRPAPPGRRRRATGRSCSRR